MQARLLHHPLDGLLREWYSDPFAQEAIYLASPTLYERFMRWLSGEQLSDVHKLLQTLYKYAIRMSTRCTPYGLFAGCSLALPADYTRLRRKNSQPVRRHSRLDIECLMAVRDWLLAQPIIRNQVLFYTNNSLYAVGGNFRYVEMQQTTASRHYFITALTGDQFLKRLFEQARTGATVPQLVNYLVEMNIEEDEACAFVEQLIDEQLLSCDLDPVLIGESYLDVLIAKVAALSDTELITQDLIQLKELVATTPNVVDLGNHIGSWLDGRQLDAPIDRLQVDSFYEEGSLTVGQSAMEHLRQQIEQLAVLNQPHHCPDMDDLKRRFYDRYEQEEIPLALALDSEYGIGYGVQSGLGVGYAPMIDDLSLPNIEGVLQPPTWNWWQSFVLNKYSESLYSHQAEIELSQADLEHIAKQRRDGQVLPESFYVFGNWLAKSGEAIDKNEYRFVMQACKGPSAATLLSRFCEGSSPLTEAVQSCVRATEQHHPDVIFAEVVHFPENRAGNILTRPTLYQYEIPYLAQSSVDQEYQIPIDDLLISVRNGRVVLRSRRLNKRVIPRLTNAHNYHQGLPTYRFLCDLQHQDSHLDVKWNWGVLAEQAYLPRVRYKNIILSRATWQLQAKDLQLGNLFQLAIQLNEKGLPQEFVVGMHDHELLVCLHNPQSLSLLVAELQKRNSVRIYEYLATADNCPVSVGGQPFTNEVVIPFRNPSAPKLFGLMPSLKTLPQRRFSVGSEWLYLKIYTGEKTSDDLLATVLYPVVEQLLAKGVINQFFFIRYKDVDPHLRLRFRGNPYLDFHHVVMRKVEEALRDRVHEGVVHRVQMDTYVREIERYGHEQIELCEAIFHYDSLSTLAFLAQHKAVFDESSRFAFAVAKIDCLLTGVGLLTGERSQLMNQMKDGFFAEFNGDVNLRRQQNEKFRHYRPLIDHALSTAYQGVPNQTVPDCMTAELTNKLRLAFPGPPQLMPILQSLIHMIINRLFPAKQRAYELVIYHCLAKHYDAQKARQPVCVEVD
ncbi:lantibiotic dehydratase [Spirosoma sp. RP8]|uniref:Lantibiotic dehydratase n=1 Tax=Spirosoma liriopis TaxID=2937440 RepID=A0ABT0HVY3_9BACT|nr:lantibiotic dehydratase [Spirosoma liriopis]MCK8496027.1 lantibiotic dehydratase [Spirosoma liriopis]